MEKKNNYCPSDRIDDSLLTQILQDNESSLRKYRTLAQGCSNDNGRSSSVTCRNNRGVDNSANGRSCRIRSEEGSTCRITDSDRNNQRSCGYNTPMHHNTNCNNTSGTQRACNYNDSVYEVRRENNGQVENGCSERCIADNCINRLRPAMVYCPDHEFSELYESVEALDRGTLFRVLDLPFYPIPCNNCR